MPVAYVPAQVQIPAHVQNHVLVESGTNWDFSRSAAVTPVVPAPPQSATSAIPASSGPAAAAVAKPSIAAASRATAAAPSSASNTTWAVAVKPVVAAIHLPPPNLFVKPKSVPKPLPVWTLREGETVSHGLEAWGKQAHWTVLWQLPRDWAVPATTVYSGSFEKAAGAVLRTLSAEGVLLKGEIYKGNHTLVVVPTGEKE